MRADTPPRTRDRVRVLLAAGGVLGLGAVGTLAAWTDDSTATSGPFSTGSIDIRLGASGSSTGTDAFGFSTFTATALKPGSTVDGTLKVYNAGTLPFTYTLSSATVAGSSATLGPALGLVVHEATCGTGATVSAAGSTVASASLASPRTLAAGASEALCFRATLPASAGTGLQSQTGSYTFTFSATNT